MNISWTKLAVAWVAVILIGGLIIVPGPEVDWRGYVAAFLWSWVGIAYPLHAGWLNKRKVP